MVVRYHGKGRVLYLLPHTGVKAPARELRHAHPGLQFNMAMPDRMRHNPQPFDWEVILCVVS